MNERQEQLSQFGLVIFFVIFTFAISSCERGINLQAIERLEQQIKDNNGTKNQRNK